MAGGKRHFNVWIAYSDLFTNLSTFLFISALGMFAALGSGLASRIDPGGGRTCAAPRIEIAQAGEAQLRYIGTYPHDAGRCTDSYEIVPARFSDQSSAISSYRHEGANRPLNESEWNMVCDQVFKAVSRGDFSATLERVSVAGVMRPNVSTGAACHFSLEVPRAVKVNGATVSNRDFLYCANPENRAELRRRPNAICNLVAQCMLPQNQYRTPGCRGIKNMDTWAVTRQAHCDRPAILAQAQSLGRQCTKVVASSGFPDWDYINSRAVHPDAKREEGRASLWARRVQYDVIDLAPAVAAVDANRANDFARRMVAVPQGRLVLTVVRKR